MGLDNSFDLHITDREKFGELPKWLKRAPWQEAMDEPNDVMVELLYWRKCYNIRGEVYDCLKDFTFPEGTDVEYCKINLDQFETIVNHLMECYNYDWWQKNDDSIWEWSDMQPKTLEDGSESNWLKVQEGVCDNYWYQMAYANRWLEFLKNKPEDSYYIQWVGSY